MSDKNGDENSNVTDEGSIVVKLCPEDRKLLEDMCGLLVALAKTGNGTVRAGNQETPRSGPQTTRKQQSSSSLPLELPPYGRSAKKPIRDASDDDLNYYRKGCEKSLRDHSKQRWHANERMMLEAIDAELRRRSDREFSEPSSVAGNNTQSGEDDIPF